MIVLVQKKVRENEKCRELKESESPEEEASD